MSNKKDPEQKTGGEQGQKVENDQSYQDNFPQAKAANATREAYQQTADQQRIAAERAKNLELQEKKEQDRKSKVNADPVPTGEGENPHEGESDAGKADDRKG